MRSPTSSSQTTGPTALIDREKILRELLADVMLWDTTRPKQEQFIRVIADWYTAAAARDYIEQHGYNVSLSSYGYYQQLIIQRIPCL